MVRCLGPGEEHTFLSPDPVNRRVCERCAKSMDAADRAGRMKARGERVSTGFRVIRKKIGSGQ
jgi:hypothetical protein